MDIPPKPSLLERLSALLSREPEDRDELLALLHSAFDRNLIDADALTIIEGALQMSDMQVRDVMVPRAQMDCVHLDDPIDVIANFAIDTAHSRFPAIGDGKDDVAGILLAKDLLRYFAGREFDLRDMLRPAVFVPESKRLNVLLREFRVSRNHMAIVVDEYGGVAGLVTIEDVLEQIVGEIDDEHDDAPGTVQQIAELPDGSFRIDALTAIEDFNARFDASLSDAEYDTIGGLVVAAMGHLPESGEELDLDRFHFRVMQADARRVHVLQMTPRPAGD